MEKEFDNDVNIDNCDYIDFGYDWTEEDSWDALTDGMYGDMPNNPSEYDAIMEAMGF